MTDILQIRPLRAQITIPDASYNQLHPFVQFKLNGLKAKTQTHFNGNRNPAWTDEVTYTGVNPNSELIVQVFDEATIESGEAVAFAEVNLSQHIKSGKIEEVTIELQNMGDPAGTITLLMKLAPPPTRGTLHIKPVRAQVTIDDPSFNQLHPYVVVKINGNKQKTNSHVNGNRNPSWGEELIFEVHENDDVVIQIFDSLNDNGEAVGFLETNVRSIAKFSQTVQSDLETQNMGDPAGYIHLETKLIPEGGDLASYLAKQQASFGFGQGGFGQGGFGQGGFAQGGFGAPQGGFGASDGGFGQGGFGAPQQGGFGAPQQGGFGAPQQGGFGQGGFGQGGFGQGF